MCALHAMYALYVMVLVDAVYVMYGSSGMYVI